MTTELRLVKVVDNKIDDFADEIFTITFTELKVAMVWAGYQNHFTTYPSDLLCKVVMDNYPQFSRMRIKEIDTDREVVVFYVPHNVKISRWFRFVQFLKGI